MYNRDDSDDEDDFSLIGTNGFNYLGTIEKSNNHDLDNKIGRVLDLSLELTVVGDGRGGAIKLRLEEIVKGSKSQQGQNNAAKNESVARVFDKSAELAANRDSGVDTMESQS